MQSNFSIESYLSSLMPSEKRYLEKIQNRTAKWMPQSKPQWLAFLSRADELFYGGSAGGGKTDLLLGMAGSAHQNSIVFRRMFPNLRAVIERSRNIYNDPNDKFNESLHIWRLENGGVLEFGAMQHEKDKFNFQGRPHDFIGVDEAPEFTETQIVFVTTWNRSPDMNQRVRVLLTGNPPSPKKWDSKWIMRRYAAWIDRMHINPAAPGELRWFATIGEKETELLRGDSFIDRGEMIYPRSRTFIPSRLDDNPFYAMDGGRYRSVLQSLPETLKRQMLYGDFYAEEVEDPFQIIPTEWVIAAQQRWLEREKPNVPLTAAGIDPSRGGDDKTALAKRYDNWFGVVKSWPGTVIKDGAIMAEMARQDFGNEEPGYINIDVSGIGSSAYDHLKPMYKNVIPFNPAEASEYRDKSKKLKMRNKRAEMYWRMRDALDPNGGADLALPPGNEILADLCSASYEVSAAGVLVQEKEEIKTKIGRSPDEGESIMMCNFPEPQRGWVRRVG